VEEKQTECGVEIKGKRLEGIAGANLERKDDVQLKNQENPRKSVTVKAFLND